MSQISPIRAPIPAWFLSALWKIPAKPPISVRVENAPNYRPVSQNTAGLHLTWWLAKPLKPICCPILYAMGHPKTLPEHHCEALFFSDGGLKKEAV
jgi:hypothetical protein